MRRRGTAIGAVLLAGLAAAQGGGDAYPLRGVVAFANLGEAWATLRSAGVLDAVLQVRSARRAGLTELVANVRREFADVEKHLGLELGGPLRAVLAGRGCFAVGDEGGAEQFLVELTPASPVAFPDIIDRFLARDPAARLLERYPVAGATVQRIRLRQGVAHVMAAGDRLVVSTSPRLLALALEGAVVPPDLWPSGGRVFVRGRVIGPPDGREPFERADFSVGIQPAALELTGRLQVRQPELLAPFTGLAPAKTGLLGRYPPGSVAAAAVRLDLGTLYDTVAALVPPGERELFKRRVTGIEYSMLGGRKLRDLLAGLGPEVLMVLSDAGEGPGLGELSAATAVRSSAARDALDSLGRLLVGISRLKDGAAGQRDIAGGTVYHSPLGGQTVALGVTADLACLSTSEALAARLLAAPAPPPPGDLREQIPPFHLFVGVDAAAAGAWLRRHEGELARRQQAGGDGGRAVDIEAAADLCRLFTYAAIVATVEDGGVDVTCRFALTAR